MAGMIEEIAQTPIMVIQPTMEIVDGQHDFFPVQAMGFITEMNSNDFSRWGNITCGKVIYVAPMLRDPVVPGKVILNGAEFDIKSIRIYRNLSGELLGYRLVVSGG